jgi:hypothetical protein
MSIREDQKPARDTFQFQMEAVALLERVAIALEQHNDLLRENMENERRRSEESPNAAFEKILPLLAGIFGLQPTERPAPGLPALVGVEAARPARRPRHSRDEVQP